MGEGKESLETQVIQAGVVVVVVVVIHVTLVVVAVVAVASPTVVAVASVTVVTVASVTVVARVVCLFRFVLGFHLVVINVVSQWNLNDSQLFHGAWNIPWQKSNDFAPGVTAADSQDQTVAERDAGSAEFWVALFVGLVAPVRRCWTVYPVGHGAYPIGGERNIEGHAGELLAARTGSDQRVGAKEEFRRRKQVIEK